MSGRTLPAALVALALLVAACSGDDDGTREAKAPDPGPASTRLGVPLLKGAVADPASADPDGEAYRVGSGVSLLDVNAFYEQQTDGKPLQGFEWCGGAGFSGNEIVRVWKKSEEHQLKLDLVGGDGGVLIKVREDTAAAATTCPPSPPVEQPFEGP